MARRLCKTFKNDTDEPFLLRRSALLVDSPQNRNNLVSVASIGACVSVCSGLLLQSAPCQLVEDEVNGLYTETAFLHS